LYSINGGPFVPALPSYNGLSAGLFTVVAQDVSGCLGTSTEMVTESSPIEPNLSVFNSVTCTGVNDGIIIATPTGGSTPLYDFTFSNGFVQIQSNSSSTGSLSTGEFSVIIENSDGCLAHDTVTLVPTSILSVNSIITDVSCNGGTNGSILVTLVGGNIATNWIWSNGVTGTPLATGLAADTYTCQITDLDGCVTSESITIIEPASNLEILATGTDLKCFKDSTGTVNASIVTNGAGGWSWFWTGPNGFTASTQQVIGLNAGEYIVEVIDAGLCAQYDTVIIDQPDSLYADLSAIDITCFANDNGMATTIMNGGTPNFSYSWTGPNSYASNSASISSLAPGNYTLNVTDLNGCPTNDMINISEPSILEAVSLVSDYNSWGVSCNGGSNGQVTITLSGGVSQYIVTYNGGFATSIIADSIFIFSNLTGGIGTFDVVDFNGCELLGTPIIITEPPLLEIVSNTFVDPSCFNANDGSIIVNVAGGIEPYNFELNGVTSPLTNLSDGTYSLLVTDINNCEVVPPNPLTLTEPLEILVTAEICLNSISIDVQNALGNYATTWTNELGNLIGTDNTVTDLTSGEYNVLIIDQPNGCVLDTTFNLVLPTINVTDATCSNSADGSIEILIDGTSFYDVFVDGLLIAEDVISTTVSNLEVGAYAITIIDDGSCEYNVIATVGYVGGYNCVEPPIIISPNFDGTNDTWNPAIDVDEDITVTIYNRWGQIEFFTENANSRTFVWDGINNDGNTLPTADYYFVIDFINQPDKTGVITYIR
jgi:gliding motility-associated-like protein